MRSRIVITGLGAVSPAGAGTQALYEALRSGQSCTHLIANIDTAGLPCKVAAEANDFDPHDFLKPSQAKRLDRSGQMFFAASQMAIDESRILQGSVNRSRFGIFEGTSLGGLGRALHEYEIYRQEGPRQVNPHTLTASMAGAGGAMVSLLHGLQGPSMTINNGSISSASAIAVAIDQLILDEIDVALAGGSEAPIDGPILALFGQAGILSTRNDTPETACRPFDATRDGIVLGEGAAALILERKESAERRNTRIYGEIPAVVLTGDAYHMVAPKPDASEQARAIALALEKSSLTPPQVDYVSAHGTATKLNDRVETLAIKKALGECAYRIPVSSSKSMLGHPLGASTALETVKTIIMMEHGFLSPTINLQVPDLECDLDYVPKVARPAKVKIALVNNSSFGGRNSCLVLRHWSNADNRS